MASLKQQNQNNRALHLIEVSYRQRGRTDVIHKLGGGRVVCASGSKTSVSSSTPTSATIYDAYTSIIKKKKIEEVIISLLVSASVSETSVLSLTSTSAIIYDAYTSQIRRGDYLVAAKSLTILDSSFFNYDDDRVIEVNFNNVEENRVYLEQEMNTFQCYKDHFVAL